MALETGFRDLAFEDLTRNALPSTRRLWMAGCALYPVTWGLHRLGLRHQRVLENNRGAILVHSTLRKGTWLYGLMTATT
jgi:hypothetical protein